MKRKRKEVLLSVFHYETNQTEIELSQESFRDYIELNEEVTESTRAHSYILS